MTDQQPQWTPIEETHLVVPSTENIRNLFEAAYPERGKDFYNWLIVHNAEVAAAAEQRGAIKAVRDAAESDDLIDHLYANLPLNQPIAVREASRYLHNRADQMEGDDETH